MRKSKIKLYNTILKVSQQKLHVSRKFSKLWQIPNSGLINLILWVTECFYFFPDSDELSQINLSLPQTADVSGAIFMSILNVIGNVIRPTCKSTGASCVSNTSYGQITWLGAHERLFV